MVLPCAVDNGHLVRGRRKRGYLSLLIWAGPQRGSERAKPRGAGIALANVWSWWGRREGAGGVAPEKSKTLSKGKVEEPD